MLTTSQAEKELEKKHSEKNVSQEHGFPIWNCSVSAADYQRQVTSGAPKGNKIFSHVQPTWFLFIQCTQSSVSREKISCTFLALPGKKQASHLYFACKTYTIHCYNKSHVDNLHSVYTFQNLRVRACLEDTLGACNNLLCCECIQLNLKVQNISTRSIV